MTSPLSYDAALEAVLAHRPARASEQVALALAAGRVLAEDVTAALDRPAADVSAMDGYAVRLEDVARAGARLALIGEAPAGAPFAGRVGPGECVRVFTGSVLPEGASHVVIQEETQRDGAIVTCTGTHPAPLHIRARGRDMRAGAPLLGAGTRLDPLALSVIAAANRGAVSVAARPRVAILANGRELKPPGSALGPGETVDANAPGLAALVEAWGGEPIGLGIAGDSLPAIAERIAAAGPVDLFLPVGGASVGDHDLMRPAFEAAGFEPVFQHVAVRPGKPTWFSARADATAVLGLPGNPASALVCAHLFLKPWLTGAPPTFVPARLSAPLDANGPRESFLRAGARLDGDARLMIEAAADQDSSLLSPFLKANALIRRRPGAEAAPAGALVEALLIRPLA